MYWTALATDLSFLNGATLSQGCVGGHEVILNLDNEASLMAASSVRLDQGVESRELADVVLRVLDSRERCESYTITYGDCVVVV